MSNLTFIYEGNKYKFELEELSKFYNHDEENRVGLNSITEFKLKDGNIIIGKVIDIKYIHAPDENGSIDHPIQVEFKVKTEDEILVLKFYEIQDHNLIPFKSRPIFKKDSPK